MSTRKILLLLGFCSCLILKSCEREITNSEIKDNLVPSKTTLSKSALQSYNVSLSDAKLLLKAHKITEHFTIDPYCIDRDTLLYVCNFEQGWMIISGDRRTFPILSEGKGRFLVKEIPKGPYVWMSSLADDIRSFRYHCTDGENEHTFFWNLIDCTGKRSGIKPPVTKNSEGTKKWYAVNNEVYEVGTPTETDIVPHLIQTKWGQGIPWNSKCPYDISAGRKCYLGCTATAIGQLLYYLHYNIGKPTGLYHDVGCTKTSVSGKTTDIGFYRNNFQSNSARWDEMAIDSIGNSTSISHASDLMLDIGNRMGMNYSGTGSGAWPKVNELYTYYNVSCQKSDYNYNYVKTDIIGDTPVIIVAYDSSDHNKGHTWLIDGLHTTTRNYTYTKKFYYDEDWYMFNEYYDTWDEVRQHYFGMIQDPSEWIVMNYSIDYPYLLMNWGYDGKYDTGYYSAAASSAWNANTYDHLYNRTIFHNVH